MLCHVDLALPDLVLFSLLSAGQGVTNPSTACRHELYTDYKAQRPPMPDAMKLAIPKIQQLLQVCTTDAAFTRDDHDQSHD